MAEDDITMATQEPAEEKESIQLSAAQVAASSLAALSAAVVCSFFGVAGTLIGTAAASVVATVGSALYSYSLRRTKARLRRLHEAGAASPAFTEVIKTTRQQGRRLWTQLPVRLLAGGVVIVFIVVMAIVTVIEVSAGKPLSNVVRGSNSDSGTSFDAHTRKTASPSPSETPAPKSSSPSPTAKPTPTHTATRRSSTPPSTPSTSPTPTTSSTSSTPRPTVTTTPTVARSS